MSRFTWSADTCCILCYHIHVRLNITRPTPTCFAMKLVQTHKKRCKMLLAQTRITMFFFGTRLFHFFFRRLLFCNICIPASKSASYRRPCSTLLPSSNILRVSLKPPSTPPTWGVPSVTLPAECRGSLAPPVCAALRQPCQCHCRCLG